MKLATQLEVTGVPALRKAIHAFIDQWNEEALPFNWAKTPESDSRGSRAYLIMGQNTSLSMMWER